MVSFQAEDRPDAPPVERKLQGAGLSSSPADRQKIAGGVKRDDAKHDTAGRGNPAERESGVKKKSSQQSQNIVLEAQDAVISYNGNPAVKGVSIRIEEHAITSIIGPSGCGKSTLLRAFNRMNDLVPAASHEGAFLYHGVDIYGKDVDPVEVRRHIGMVFQKPNPFPKSIYKNVAWGPTINGYSGDLDALVEQSLKSAALWEEVCDRLHDSALGLSGGQQQRLCIARALAMAPEVILMDEPCSALDPVSTSRIEDLLFELKGSYTIVIVTHNMQQAARVSDYTAFLENGHLVEFGVTEELFTRPKEKRTEDYVSGRFG